MQIYIIRTSKIQAVRLSDKYIHLLTYELVQSWQPRSCERHDAVPQQRVRELGTVSPDELSSDQDQWEDMPHRIDAETERGMESCVIQ